MGDNKICIRPTSSVYATYRRLSYKPWFAIAEFVDNSTQSFFKYRDSLVKCNINANEKYNLIIEINYNNIDNTLIIKDNAFGMEMDDFIRALVLDRPPSDKSGRSEYGMGLKTAACWFGTKWTVETTQLGSNRLLTATIDVENLAVTHEDDISYEVSHINENEHFTYITIQNIQQPIRGRTLTRVWEQLGSIYRQDIRSGEIKIFWNGVPLTFDEPNFYEDVDEDNNQVIWKNNINFEVPWQKNNTQLTVNGWIGILSQGKQRDAGLVLMRRGRVIAGGPNEGYKPLEIFGQANSFRSQRLIGELNMDDWPVTQAKDGFDWSDGLEESFITELIPICKNFGDKAESIRLLDNKKRITNDDMKKTSKSMQSILNSNEISKWIKSEINQQQIITEKTSYDTSNISECLALDTDIKEKQPCISETLKLEESYEELLEQEEKLGNIIKKISDGPITYPLKIDDRNWIFNLYWQDKLSSANWMEITYPDEHIIDIFLNIAHPFFRTYINDYEALELLQKLVIALALAERMSRITSSNPDLLVDPADFRVYMNKILKIISDMEMNLNYA